VRTHRRRLVSDELVTHNLVSISDSPAGNGMSSPSRTALPEQPQGIIAGALFHRRETKGAEMGAAGPFLGFTMMVLAAAAQAIGRNKLRSALTVLGVFIGEAALIAMVAVGEGANEAVKKVSVWRTTRLTG
jgi:hypothetical protein